MQQYWQKKPLLVRNALPGFNGLLTRDELIALACRDDAESRLVTQKNGKWQLTHGPLDDSDFTRLPKKQWTVLVQGINHFLPSARDLLAQFRFVPHTRLDDLMVSYAPKGGGIGPHFDSYDVFLLQGMGSRRWQISSQQDDRFIEGAPLRILQHFYPQQEWILQPGDMLYLPPHYAHNGIAEEDCMTYSIGFRAPNHQELISQFLVYLQDHLQVTGWYSDPDLRMQRHPSRISTAMKAQVAMALKKIHWDKSDIEDFLGTYLSEPKSHIFFSAPRKPMDAATFKRRAEEYGIALDLKTRLLSSNDKLFINGEAIQVNSVAHQILTKLADHYRLEPAEAIEDEAVETLYQWYLSGYLNIAG